MIHPPLLPPAVRRLLSALAVLSVFTVATFAAEPAKKNFDVPAGDAIATLRRAAQQAGVEIMFPAATVHGVKTAAVKGEFTPRAALERMLVGTGLVAVQDEKTGALAVRRTALPNAERAAPASDRPDQSKIESGRVVLDKYEVNGTRLTGVINQGIIPREENQAVRYNIISRDDIERSGVTSLPELMRRVSSNQESGTSSQRASALTTGATGTLNANDTVNLRGFGAGQTLIMINGRRLYGVDGGGADINRIPIAAIERVEILPSSGSAIYGANSGGGVVNVILRTGYQGTEVTTYLGATTAGGAEEVRFDVYSGLSFNQGRSSLTLSLNFNHTDDLQRGQRDYDERVLLNPNAPPGSTPFLSTIVPWFLARRGMIVTSSPLGLGIAANPTALYASIPTGSNGVGLTPASFATTVGTTSVSTERITHTLLRNPSTAEAAVLTFDHAIFGETLGFYSELTWREDASSVGYPSALSTFSLSATDPLNPFRTNVTPGFVGRAIIIYRDQADLPDSRQESRRRTLRTVTGFKGRWTTGGDRTYAWSVDGSWDRNDSENTTRDYPASIMLPAVNAGVYNIFRDLTGVPPMSASEAAKFGYKVLSKVTPALLAGNARLNGDLFALWGGPAKFSLVAESRQERYRTIRENSEIGEYNYLPGGTGATLALPVATTETIRDFLAVGGEVELPLVGRTNRKPWLHSLDVSAGTRYEKNTGYFGATPPLGALKLGVTRDLAFRVAYQEGFQPPSLFALTTPTTTTLNVSSAGYVDALRPGQVNPSFTSIVSGNPDLRPETAKTWDVGVVLTPRWVPGLTVNAAYFRSDKQDVVSSLSLTAAITVSPELIVRDAPSAADIAAGRPGPINTFTNKSINLARQFTDGFEWTVRYDLAPTSWGRFAFTSNGTHTKRFFTQTRPDLPNVSTLDLAPLSGNVILKNKVNAGVTWNREAWGASVLGSYSGAFETPTTTRSALNPTGTGIDGDRIPSALTFDVQVSYAIPVASGQTSGWSSWIGGTKWSVGALNVFDEAPALWTDRLRGFYSPFVDPRQRFVYFQIKKTL